jgi:peptide/nickel transport system substrate-binding protein
MHRRSLAKAAAAAFLPLPGAAQAPPARTLRFVPQANLSVLDPIWTTAAVTVGHGYHVFDTLYGVDGRMQPRPQMAAGHEVSEDGRTWLIRLRDGLRFHDGEPVRAVDCAASLARWSKRDALGQLLAQSVDTWEAADDRTVRIRLRQPFPRMLDALGKPGTPPFMMPERLARTDPSTQVSEMVGSGPYRFLKDEYVSGSRIAYARFEGYVPREEPAEWMSGGKRVFFDRLEWQIIPDPATASAALQAGEVDWWEMALPDLVPTLRRNPNVRVQVADPFGFYSILRFNCATPPFNNVRLRRALLPAFDQRDYMSVIVAGDAQSFRTCFAMFPCGLPYVGEPGADLMKPPIDLDRVRAAVRDAGYAGEKVVILNPTDIPTAAPHGQMAADVLRRIGMNVDLQEMDWGTVVQRRNSREPAEQGGWNLFATNGASVILSNPAVNPYIRGQGANGWYGWYENPEIERLAREWLRATSEVEQQRTFDAAQRTLFDNPPIVPLGQYFPLTAFRRDLSGVLQAAYALPWNVRRAT